MRFAAALVVVSLALVAVSLGQPPAAPQAPAPEYYPLSSRNIKIPIKYERDRKSIRQVKLYVARNGENTWYQEAAIPPDRDFFTYVAKEDGIYWFTIVEEDLQGKNIPADLTRHPPDQKILVDTVPPRVQFTTARRNGEEVVVEWFVDDKYPDENATKVHFRAAAGDGYWQEVSLPANSKSGVRFPAGTTNPVIVRVTACDLAGNKTEATREIGPNGATAPNPQASTSMSPAGPTPTPPAATPGATPGGPVAPGQPGPGPIPPPGNLAPAAPLPPASPPGTTGTPTGPTAPVAPPTTGGPLPTTDPRQPVVPAVPPATGNTGGPSPVAVWSGPGVPAAPTVELSRAQVTNLLAFDLNYEVEARGTSDISRIDLWVTRDDGRTWLKWSQCNDCKGGKVRVNLNVPANPQPEGVYGFRLVPTSGAGLSEREPIAGDAPELRVIVDVTPPQLDLFPPAGDPTNPDTLVIQWKATDKNFGEDPVTIEWGERPAGPWQPVAVGDVVQAGAASVPQARRLPNTGQYAWRVPAGLPPRVYLKITARDAAGNEKVVVTRDPILVDLVKPRVKISGIAAPGGLPRP